MGNSFSSGDLPATSGSSSVASSGVTDRVCGSLRLEAAEAPPGGWISRLDSGETMRFGLPHLSSQKEPLILTVRT